MSDSKPSLGECLKLLRRERGWTLTQVAQMSGLAISTLSKVENNQMSLTYDKLLQLAQGLKVDITELFGARKASASPIAHGARAVSRLEDGRIVETPNYVYRFLCTELSRKEMIPMLGSITQQSIETFGELIRHPGQEFTYVLEGEVELHTDVYETLRLKTGESVYFESTMGHAYVSVGDMPARILCVCTSASGQSEQTIINGAKSVRPHDERETADTEMTLG
ncbi:XRE family transcriptional regulator [Mesorhizobium sp. M8A.F.Ca.ET.207.01.1.1]|uniref:helix-turn-helix domain-containing protein n=1 Tax=Mesorhizobium sp. M8A.F.Ca.ET.207.01.1.1 TaxID=2563968 RepID=UPI00109D0FF8|nr:XRE family transcriptional regulator [Mesorhizobium sp. M8A.F.Ca.ET.207.01.1.1]TGQ80223.1 XRE family transcriptional regulator [Mesorhizobium sp. M8A.F.Ca.ET.207.01.1.1]